MARRQKVWRVRQEYDGRVTIATQVKPLILSNSLSQQRLLELSKNEVAIQFMERVTQTIKTNEG